MSEKFHGLIWHFMSLIVGGLLVFVFKNGAAVKGPPLSLLSPPTDLGHFTFGYNENFSDSLWLRLIQDIDHCDGPIKLDETWGAELCSVEKGWVYRMLESITELTPQFRAPYAFGAITLSVIVNDKPGAAVIFERAVKQFPRDWAIQYRAAYHYLYEIKNAGRAAELLTLAGQNGAPAWVFALAGKLYTKAGQVEVAKTVLLSLIEQHPEGRFTERLRQRLAQIEAGGADLELSTADPASSESAQ